MATVASDDRVLTPAAPRQVPPHRRGAREEDLLLAVTRMHGAFRAAPLPLDLPGVGPVRDERDLVIAQGEDYVLPRLAGLEGPALVVVGGPTGAGKSTLVNSLVGHQVTTPGLLRPTTRSPVLVHHPADHEWFGPDRVLPSLDRVDHATSDQGAIQLVATTNVPHGVAILDAPDFDSVDDRNRELATKLLAAADLLLFVTSAARYSDQVPWLQLSLALQRQTAISVVMNRIPAEDRATVTPHLTQMLRDTGVRGDHVFFVEEGTVTQGRLPAPAVAEVRGWLADLAADAGARSSTVRQTVSGAIRRAITIAEPVAQAATLQVEAISELLTGADGVYAAAAERLREDLTDGVLLSGDLLVEWSDFAGHPALDLTVAALRSELDHGGTDLAERVDRIGLAVDLALETLLLDHAQRAAAVASARLRASSHGAALLDWSAEDLSRPGRGLAARARKAIRAVRHRLATRVSGELDGEGGLGPVGCAAVAVAAIVHGVSSPAPPPWSDDDPETREKAPIGRLVTAARDDVVRTLTALLAEDRDRYLQPVLAWNLAPDAAARLRAAANDAARTLARHERQGS